MKKLFHMYGWDNIETEYNMRLNSYSSYVTDLLFIQFRMKNNKETLSILYFLFLTERWVLILKKS
ncbi:hypothetical protein [Staphylococcus haemolyticus]|uniref:hypothetical protein n=1 Tax=Staphylococcus haemolyticus TaxID=1283 RepID=UPI002175642B|nr:hypothetical protein [Staphylococcus haemolyticus]